MGWQGVSLPQGWLAHRQGPRHNLILSIIYLEATLSCREVLLNTNSFDIEERVVNKAIGPLAVGRRQVNYLLSFQGTLERNQGRVPLVPRGRGWRLLLSVYPTTATTGATVQQVLLVVMVVVWWGWRGCCGCCLGGCRWGGGGRRSGRSGGSGGRGLGVLASLPCPLAVLDEAQELQGALPLAIRTLSPTTLIASFAAQVVLAADGDPSPEALHDSTVHSRGD